MKPSLLVLPVAMTLGCAGQLHFADRAILWHDPDDAPVPAPHKRKDLEIAWEGMRDALFRPAQRFFSADYLTEARNVNALDEVPDSSWFVDRRRDPTAPDDQPRWHHLAPEVVERGAAVEPGPVLPLTVLKEKTEGSASGLVVTDAHGVKFQLKFDPPGYPGLVSSVEVVVTRLAWAAGWNVPGDTLIEFGRQDMQLAPDAWTLDRFGHHRQLTAGALDDVINHVAVDGRVHAVASRWIEGELLGWFSYLGRDKHDENDRVDHQYRRDLRGFGVWAAWVDDVDTYENNTLDAYVGAPGRGHVVHYQQGVGASFGRFAGLPIEYWMGQQPYFTPSNVLLSLVTLGFLPRPWEDSRLKRARARALVEWPQLGFYEAAHFDPRHWQPLAQNPGFVRQTRRDRYWGAKQVVAFNEEEIRAAIRAGHFPPLAAEHLFDVLWRRRERIARAFFTDVAPLDHFRLEDERLCFEDLWVTAGLGDEPGTAYEARERATPARPLALQHGCVVVPRGAGYRVVELRVYRPAQRHFGPPVAVHLVERDGVRHIVGIER